MLTLVENELECEIPEERIRIVTEGVFWKISSFGRYCLFFQPLVRTITMTPRFFWENENLFLSPGAHHYCLTNGNCHGPGSHLSRTLPFQCYFPNLKPPPPPTSFHLISQINHPGEEEAKYVFQEHIFKHLLFKSSNSIKMRYHTRIE